MVWNTVVSSAIDDIYSVAYSGVNCPSVNDCWVVGQGLIEHDVDGTWSDADDYAAATSLNASGYQGYVSAVTCASPSECWAVGSAQDDSGRTAVWETLIEEYSHGVWSLVASPNPAGGTILLADVACADATDCWAVGSYSVGFSDHTLIEQYAGGQWSIVPSPEPPQPVAPPIVESWLYGVTCANATCWAVGDTDTTTSVGHQNVPLIDRYTRGTGWTTSPSQSAVSGGLDDVACVDASNCWAVGSSSGGDPLGGGGSGGTLRAVIEHYTGGTWSQATSPSVAPATDSERPSLGSTLLRIACSDNGNCTAVGIYLPASGLSRGIATCFLDEECTGTLVEQETDGRWMVTPSPSPAGASDLYGVSCPSATACLAVGTGDGVTLAEEGTAAYVVTPPEPVGQQAQVRHWEAQVGGQLEQIEFDLSGAYLDDLVNGSVHFPNTLSPDPKLASLCNDLTEDAEPARDDAPAPEATLNSLWQETLLQWTDGGSACGVGAITGNATILEQGLLALSLGDRDYTALLAQIDAITGQSQRPNAAASWSTWTWTPGDPCWDEPPSGSSYCPTG
jgi:hypothetical protein